MTTKEALQANISAAAQVLAEANAALFDWEQKPENNVFESLDVANQKIEGALNSLANDACEGSYCCGDDTYTRHFIVDGVEYVGTLTVEYNRHDKTYYYVDSSDYTSAPFNAA